MRGVTILDRDPTSKALSFDLRDILHVLGEDAIQSEWRLKDVECLGDAAEALHRASDTGQVLSGARLVELAAGVQVVDGAFSARHPDEQHDWVIIRAVDSSAFDVLSNRDSVLSALTARFSRVEELPA